MEVSNERFIQVAPNFYPIDCISIFLSIDRVGRRRTYFRKKIDILKLLEVSGLLTQMDYIKDGVINPYSRMISLTYPKVPDPFWNEFNELIGTEEMKLLLDRMVLVYNKHMSHKAIKQLIKMFSTSFWEEWKQKMPTISREGGLIGSQWTQELSQSEKLKNKLDQLVKKYELDKLNAEFKPPSKN